MRSLMLALMCVACVGPGAAVRQEKPIAYDTALVDDCVPDWQEPPPAACEKNEEGTTVLRNDDPSFRKVAQVISMEDSTQGSASMDAAIVTLAGKALVDPGTSECGRQIFRWHRALALHRLGRWDDSFVDFASVVKDGPNNPFYKDVGAWLDTLAPHLPRAAYITCLSAYDPASLPKTAPE